MEYNKLTRTLLKLAFYNFVATFYLRLSSRHLAKSTLLNDKAEVYMEKQRAIQSVLTKNN